MKTIYLCGPIHGMSDAECNNWRRTVASIWMGHCADPMRRDARGRMAEPGIAKEIVEADKADIEACDGLLVYFAMPSVGTSMEVLHAWNLKKPIVVVNATLRPVEDMSLWMRYHATKICPDISSAVCELEELLFFGKQHRRAGLSAA